MKFILIFTILFTFSTAEHIYVSDKSLFKETTKMVFIGDSLTERRDKRSYVNDLIDRVSELYNNNIVLGYIPLEYYRTKLDGVKLGLTSSELKRMWGESDRKFSEPPYAFSPDGKGIYVETIKKPGITFLTINLAFKENKTYDMIRIYYMKQPKGGSFTVEFKDGESKDKVEVNTASKSYSLGWIDISSSAQKRDKIYMSGITENTAIYGVRPYSLGLPPRSFSYDVFARNGILLKDFTQLSNIATHQYFKDGRYDVAVINLGTNDARYGDRGGIPVEEFRQRMLVYVNKIKQASPGTKIVLLEPVMPQDYYSNGNQLEEYTEERIKMAIRYGWGYIDTHLLWEGYNHEYYKDGTHPNDRGKKAIAELVFDYLNNN
ncbi:MAG TPA: SGNH/GDSL hydrolase family protein [Archaeoglobus profundus]|nr:SGNH/GDSL hydrolase family protein [Archaeoglobus profundus]HIP58311.1 SGNH/GDSL hydrolase family protein [Archaeoglobus profundus]